MKIGNIFSVMFLLQTQKSSGETYQKMIRAASWPEALSSCQTLSGFFVPDLGKGEIIKNILPQMKKEETVWLNAKEIILEYHDNKSETSVYRYVEMSYRCVDTYLDNYFCVKDNNGSKIKKSTWHKAREICMENGGNIFTVYPKSTKYTRHFLKDGQVTWTGKYGNSVLPKMDSAQYGLTEMCIVIMKESEGTFQYRAANCTEEEYKYFCDVALNVSEKYAPTIQSLPKSLPQIENGSLISSSSMEENNIPGINEEEGGETTDIVVIVGPAVAGGLLIVVGVVVIVVIMKKRESQRRYRKRWNRYQNGRQRPNITTIQHINPDGTLESSTSRKELLSKEEQGRKYAHLREGTSGQSQQVANNKTHNIDQPDYYLMDATSKKPTYINKRAELEAVTCYETYDPDLVELDQQIQNRNEGKIPVRLQSDLPTSGELKKSLMMVEMKQKIKSQNDLDRDEHSFNDDKPPKLPIKKFKSPLYTKPIKGKMAEKPTAGVRLPLQKDESMTQALQVDTPKHLDDLDQYEGVSVGGPQNLANACQRTKIQNTQNVQENLVDLSLYESFGTEDSSASKVPESEGINALDQYENFDLPVIKSPNVNNIPVYPEGTRSQSLQVQNLADLDQYENLSCQQISRKETAISLKNSNMYAEYPLCTTVKI